MWRLVVTAKATGPIWDKMASQAAESAKVIMAGPDKVPPGRPCRSVTLSTMSIPVASTPVTP